VNDAADVGWRLRGAHRARAWKIRLAEGRQGPRAAVPALEIVEVLLAHGLRETADRVCRRVLGADAALRVWPRVVIPPMRRPHGASIVIPIRDQPALTHACLSAIVDHTPPGHYEVIVVDNASRRPTRRMLNHVEGIRIIRNFRNAGFVDASNAGARAAAGRFVVFLNNDTAVCPGWLDALISALTRHPAAGAVGAKLLYPDGRLQEAGSIIFRDGSGWNYGRGENAEAPEYNYVREVDYCSGACLMVRRECFEALGGFDRAYAPAYYEDTDLCFRLRELDYTVVYQPAARVVHVEGATAGTDPAAGFKAFQARNQPIFVERHRRALERQPPGEAADIRSASSRRRGLRVLVVDHRVPQPDQDSGSVRMNAILRILGDLGCRVTLWPDDLVRGEPYVSELQQRGIEVLYGPILPEQYISRHARSFDVAILCRAHIAARYLEPIRAASPFIHIIFDTVDLHYLREGRRADIESDPSAAREAELTKSVELGVVRASELVWVTSTYEADLLQRDAPGARVVVLPNIHEVRGDVPPFVARRDILFVGGFQHQPNEDAVVHFSRDIMPLLRSRLPAIRLIVVGSHVTPKVQALACGDIQVRGFVPVIEPVFDAVRLSIAPLRYGAGVKGKISQSLAMGVPVVTTPVGAEGMGLRHGLHAMVAADPDDFARCVAEVYTDEALWSRLSSAGRELLRNAMGYEAVRETISGALGSFRSGA